MKYTQISPKNSELLENLIMKHGLIVTTQQIFAEAGTFLSHSQTEYLVATLKKNGWLMPIKKGIYVISDLSTRGFLVVSCYVVANLLVKDSYVSFESALQYHGMFDQLINKTISVSLKMYKTVQLENIEYKFVKTKSKYFFGWKEVEVENKTARVATAEKALIDIINFHRSIYAIDLVIEKLKEHRNDFNFEKLNDYIERMSMTTIKIFGFIFDLLKIDSSRLLKLTKAVKGAHRMTAKAHIFNAKWRLYYDTYFDTFRNS